MPVEANPRIALRLRLDTGPCSIPLYRVHHLAGYATLAGEPEDYFLGWLTFHGEAVPVFDLNRIVCDQPTPEVFGSRILMVAAAPESPTPLLGLLATGITDTLSPGDPHHSDFPRLDLDAYLPMLYTLIPPLPVSA